MTSIELLTILNSIRDSYILEARNIGNPQKPKMSAPGGGNPGETPLLFSSEKTPGRYQAQKPRKRKNNGLKGFLVLSAAAGLLLAALAGRGTIAGWGDYFETFRNRTKNPYQYTQPVDATEPSQEETETMLAENGVFYICADGTFVPVSRIAGGTQLLTGSMVLSSDVLANAMQNAPLAEALNQTETPAGSGLGPVASDGTWNFFPDDVQYNTYTPENQPDRGEWTAFFEERLQAMGLDAPILIQTSASFQKNGTEIALVTASNVRATENWDLLEVEEITQTDRPGNNAPGVYVITALFAEGEETTELYAQYSEISSSMGADYLPWSQDGSYMQPLSAMQFGSDGSVAEYPIFADMNGELVLRILGVQPDFLVADVDGDGTSEVIICLTGVSSDMSWCKVYSFRSGSLEETLHLAETISQSKPVSLEPVTFDGYALNSEGLTDQIRLTMSVENVLEGEAAYQQILSEGTQLPVPEQGKEYILVTVKVTYEDGDLNTFHFAENYPASWAAARVHFNIPNENSNTEDVTRQLPNCIWGPDEFEGRTILKGESITGDVAFLQDVGNTEPLYFEGYNQVIKFQVH